MSCLSSRPISDRGDRCSDLKSENVLVDKRNDALVTDFGFPRPVSRDASGVPLLSDTFCGSKPYVAPEVVEQKPYDPFVSDVRAFGVVVYSMLQLTVPFDDKLAEERFLESQKSRRIHFHTPVGAQARDLMFKCLQPDVKKRLTMEQVD